MELKPQLAQKIYGLAHRVGCFRLRSGAMSTEYFDKYCFESDPMVLRSIAGQMLPLIPSGVERLAGLEMGGIPIATMLSQVTGIAAVFVRKKAKDYGTCRYAEGCEVAGKHLLVVEDVVTSGGQIVESARALRSDGAVITDVICVIDRGAGGRENLQREKLNLISLFTMTELTEARIIQ